MLLRRGAAGLLLLASLGNSQPGFAVTEKVPAKFDYEPEAYTERGVTTGCGVSFDVAWKNDSQEILGATGSFTFFFIPQHKNVMAVIKVSGVIMLQQVPVQFAWIGAHGYGKTTDFTPGQSDSPGAFIAARHSDPKWFSLPDAMTRSGFVLGVEFQGRPLDEQVRLPPAPASVKAKVEDCLSELHASIEAGMN